MNMQERYIGLMSGTSMDGIDAALITYQDDQLTLEATTSLAYPDDLRIALQDTQIKPACELAHIGRLDCRVGKAFANCVKQLLAQTGLHAQQIMAIGSHGQTIHHQPDGDHCFSWQIGDASIIAYETGITTVADFRRNDIAAGGQGAPLAPAFHQAIFTQEDSATAVINIGGIANISVLPAGKSKQNIIGYDTGPGNTLLDSWYRQHYNGEYDPGGEVALAHTIQESLLRQLLTDAYFHQPAPKSTGRDYFTPAWLQQKISGTEQTYQPGDVLATLAALTADSIAHAVHQHDCGQQLWICGGGHLNCAIMQRLQTQCPQYTIAQTGQHSIDAQWIEACAFAWLARQRIKQLPGNIPSVTGAKRAIPLGSIWQI